MFFYARFLLTALMLTAPHAQAGLIESIEKIKPAVVAIGIYSPLASPRVKLVGTGFAVADGTQIVTNYHVISTALNVKKNESYVVLSGKADAVKIHPVLSTNTDAAYDLAVLTIESRLPAASISQEPLSAEGTEIAFTGFPITSVLGLYPATHKGIISAQTPVVIPADSSGQLQAAALRKLKQPYLVYQLDATAYPGNSGSPLYKAENAEVIGIINKVYIKSTREAVLSDPSAISYAIPINYIQPLLKQKNN